MDIFALIILSVFTLVGLAAVFFTTFGTFLILVGSLLYAGLTHFSSIGGRTIAVLLILYLCGEVMEYLLVIWGAKRFGASNLAAVGAVLGGIAGAVSGLAVLGVGPVLGAFLGIFLGAFLVEFLVQRDLVASLRAGAGGVVGRIGVIAVKLIIALVMIALIVSRIMASLA